MAKKKKSSRIIMPFDHCKTEGVLFDIQCVGISECHIPATSEYLTELNESIFLWEDMIEMDLEREDYESVRSDRKSLQECKLEKIRVKNELRVMMKKNVKEEICA